MQPARASEQSAAIQRPGLLRRLAAIFYDSLILLALLILATFPLMLFTHGRPIPAGTRAYTFYLLVVAWLFFAGFWTHGGQTVGMRSWRLRLATVDGEPVGWMRATLRFAAAILSWAAFGLGFLWQWLDPDGLCWHDRLSGTTLQFLPRQPRRAGPEPGSGPG
ncbi:MAG TPA: RDD family protein [Gammaproteobacteria bacterium]|nr:RDD family protein [Gammaproteobacteria bacterium]